MCAMSISPTNLSDKHRNTENGNHITSIYVRDNPDTIQNSFVQYGCQVENFPERSGGEMVEITNLENSFPPPPSSTYLESINRN